MVGDDLFFERKRTAKILSVQVPASFLPGIEVAGRADN